MDFVDAEGDTLGEVLWFVSVRRSIRTLSDSPTRLVLRGDVGVSGKYAWESHVLPFPEIFTTNLTGVPRNQIATIRLVLERYESAELRVKKIVIRPK